MAIFVDIEKKMGDFTLDVKFEAENETFTFLGASGSGKSMTLKCIAGIEKPDRGKIVLDGVTLFNSEKKINLPPQKRKTGLLFQNYALFPNMTVVQNIQAGARKKGKEVVWEMMEVFQIADLAKHYPHQLSGGQQQRVALARLLVSDPEILLLDEPFSALDGHLRLKMEQEVREILKQFGKTVLLVSHDRDEVFRMSNRIALMNQGKLDMIGTKKEVFENPKTKEGTILTGCKNISEVQIVGEKQVYALEWGITLQVAHAVQDIKYIGIRAHDIQMTSGENEIASEVIQTIENPFSYTVLLKSGLIWEVDKKFWEKNHKRYVDISISPQSIILLKE